MPSIEENLTSLGKLEGGVAKVGGMVYSCGNLLVKMDMLTLVLQARRPRVSGQSSMVAAELTWQSMLSTME